LLNGGQPVVAARDERYLRQVSEAGNGRYFDITDEDGIESLVSDLRDVSGDTEEPPPPPVDAAFLLVLAAIPLLLWDAVADAGRSLRRDHLPEAAS
jgi:hypothetical protein